VTEAVESESVEAGSFDCREPHALSEKAASERPAFGCGEDEVAGIVVFGSREVLRE
jgi:hypothetical protein